MHCSLVGSIRWFSTLYTVRTVDDWLIGNTNLLVNSRLFAWYRARKDNIAYPIHRNLFLGHIVFRFYLRTSNYFRLDDKQIDSMCSARSSRWFCWQYLPSLGGWKNGLKSHAFRRNHVIIESIATCLCWVNRLCWLVSNRDNNSHNKNS